MACLWLRGLPAQPPARYLAQALEPVLVLSMCPSVYIEGGENWGWKLITQGRSALLFLEREGSPGGFSAPPSGQDHTRLYPPATWLTPPYPRSVFSSNYSYEVLPAS